MVWLVLNAVYKVANFIQHPVYCLLCQTSDVKGLIVRRTVWYIAMYRDTKVSKTMNLNQNLDSRDKTKMIKSDKKTK